MDGVGVGLCYGSGLFEVFWVGLEGFGSFMVNVNEGGSVSSESHPFACIKYFAEDFKP